MNCFYIGLLTDMPEKPEGIKRIFSHFIQAGSLQWFIISVVVHYCEDTKKPEG